jgi:hypothetical protein
VVIVSPGEAENSLFVVNSGKFGRLIPEKIAGGHRTNPVKPGQVISS